MEKSEIIKRLETPLDMQKEWDMLETKISTFEKLSENQFLQLGIMKYREILKIARRDKDKKSMKNTIGMFQWSLDQINNGGELTKHQTSSLVIMLSLALYILEGR